MTYEEHRPNMPRPLPEDDLGEWVADLDTGMTGTCVPSGGDGLLSRFTN